MARHRVGGMLVAAVSLWRATCQVPGGGARACHEVARVTSRRRSAMADDKRRDTIQQYVGDMVSLEGHVEQALDRQMDSFKDDPQFGQYIQLFHGAVKQHRDQLRDHLKTLG